MTYNSNKNLTSYSQALRKNMTEQERKLWYEFWKGLPYTIKRQHVVGGYILDFYCEKVKTAIELDGSQHYEDSGMIYDSERTAALNSLGITVLRYSNADINTNFRGVCNDILLKFGLLDNDN